MLHRQSLRHGRGIILDNREDVAVKKLSTLVSGVSALLTGPISLCLNSTTSNVVEGLSGWDSIKHNETKIPNRKAQLARKSGYLKSASLKNTPPNYRTTAETQQIVSAVAAFENARQAGYNTTDILKPRLDKSNYRYIVLNNGVKVMLISDESCPRAACSLCLSVGFAQDPKQFPGLAYLFGALIQRGSEKYPSSALTEFFNQHGGSKSLEVTEQLTIYDFDVKPEHLDRGLDLLAASIGSPLLSKYRLNCELGVVDSHSTIFFKMDSWRYELVLRSLANPKHPLQNVSVGSFKLLRDGPRVKYHDLQDAVAQFYERNISSNTMTLCVIGREPLDELEKMVSRDRFARIENKNIPITYGSACILEDEPLYRPEDLGKMVRVTHRHLFHCVIKYWIDFDRNDN